MERSVVIVLAYDHREYRQKVREIRERSDQKIAFVFGNSVDRMRSLQADKVITCDGFWERQDAIDLAQKANSRLKSNA